MRYLSDFFLSFKDIKYLYKMNVVVKYFEKLGFKKENIILGYRRLR